MTPRNARRRTGTEYPTLRLPPAEPLPVLCGKLFRYSLVYYREWQPCAGFRVAIVGRPDRKTPMMSSAE